MNLTRIQLIRLLNTLYYENVKNIEVSYQPVDMIFSMNLQTGKLHIIGKKDYGKRRSEFINTLDENTSGQYLNEIPRSEVIKDCLYVSGVLPPANLNEIKETLIKETNRDLWQGEKPLVIGFDTNILWRRTNVHIQRILEEKKLTARYALSTLVYEELHHKYDKKLPYEWTPPEALEFMQNFSNQLTYSARAPRLGAVEYRKLKELPHTTEVTGTSTGNPDMNIIKTYESISSADILLISGDVNFRDAARAKSMKAIEVKQPHKAPEELTVNWAGACDLIYTTAVLLGTIQINGMTIQGMWRGKTEDEWNSEQVKVFAEGQINSKLKKFQRINPT